MFAKILDIRFLVSENRFSGNRNNIGNTKNLIYRFYRHKLRLMLEGAFSTGGKQNINPVFMYGDSARVSDQWA